MFKNPRRTFIKDLSDTSRSPRRSTKLRAPLAKEKYPDLSHENALRIALPFRGKLELLCRELTYQLWEMAYGRYPETKY